MIVFGTGKLFATGDETSTATQSIYGVWDKPTDSVARPMRRNPGLLTLRGRPLTAVTSTRFYELGSGEAVNYLGSERGWFIDVSGGTGPIARGRVIYPTQTISSDLVLVTVVAPPAPAAAVCEVNRPVGVDLVFSVENGRATSYPLFDTNGDSTVNGSDSNYSGVGTNSVGRRAINWGVGPGGGPGGGPTPCRPGYSLRVIFNDTGQEEKICVRDPTGPNAKVFSTIWREIKN